ncbi:MAG: XRE family transcriptional regulator [Sphingobacteriales bacterium]|nr:MAG: XRE family transcriptional regulator [Sphingobacteriales bacterium]
MISFDNYKSKFGERIKTLRTNKGYKVREFALLADIEHHQLINIEAGRVDLRFSTIHKIALALDIQISELFLI